MLVSGVDQKLLRESSKAFCDIRRFTLPRLYEIRRIALVLYFYLIERVYVNKLILATTVLISTTVLSGCASKPQTGVNSPAQVAALVDKFNSTCQALGGTVGKAVAQGSLGLCSRDGKGANLYIHRDFILLNSERPAEAYASAQDYTLTNCGKDKGTYESGDRFVGPVLKGPPDGKVNCKANDWNVSVSAPLIDNGTRKTMVSATVRRAAAGLTAEGTVPDEFFSLALRYSTS